MVAGARQRLYDAAVLSGGELLNSVATPLTGQTPTTGQKNTLMLEAIRKRSSGIVIKGLLAMLILSFALWGIADVFTPGGVDRTVATVGETEVSPVAVRRDFQREVERLSGMLGTRLDTEQARALGVADGVLNRIIDRTLFGLAAVDQGIIVSDELVRRDIRNISEFKSANGDFDRLRFQQALQLNGLSEQGFVALTREDMTRTQYLSIIAAAPAAPKRMTNVLYAYHNEKRVAEVLAIPYSTVAVSPAPDDAQLAEFHTKNAARFTAPEFRSLTYISLTAGDLAKEIAISDEEIVAAFESRKDEFMTPEKRVLKQIRTKDEVAAKRAYDMLKGGADFASVAKEVADLSADQIDLGAMTRGQLPLELAEAAFTLNRGEFSMPLKSVLGWHILSLVDIIPQIQRTLDETKEGISADIATEKAIESLYRVANGLEDELGGGATLEEAARAHNLPIRTIPAIDRNGTANGARVENIPSGNFLQIAFDTPEGQDSQLAETGSDGYFIVRVNSVTAPNLNPLASIRNDVIKAWQDEQQALDAKKLADDLIAKLKAGSQLETLAEGLGLTVTVTEPITRRSNAAGLPPGLISSLFSASVGDASEAAANGAHIVARLQNVIEVNTVAEKKKLDEMGQQLTQAMRSDLLGQLAGGLRKSYPVTVNSASLDALF